MALIRSNLNSGGGSYDTFTVSGNSSNVAGTNFTVGKYYIILFKDLQGSATLTGANKISEIALTDLYANDQYHAYLVEATASTITIGNAGYIGCHPMPVELTL